MGEVEMRRLSLVVLGGLLAALVACERSENADEGLGPAVACIVFECAPDELRARVKSSADANRTGAMGRTPLMYAAGIHLTLSDRIWSRAGRPPRKANRPEYVRILLAAGAKIDAIDDLGTTALGAAIYNGDPEVVRLLLDAKADPNARMGNELPLSLAALHCDSAIAKILIDAGARVDAKDAVTGATAVDVARREGCESMFEG